MTAWRVLIVDDEAPARRLIRSLLGRAENMRIVGEAADGREALEKIRTLTPDIVLLDIHMPRLDGFGLVARVGSEAMPLFILITAHEEHALRAFGIRAFDYLLKPIMPEALLGALKRAHERLTVDAHSTSGDPPGAEFTPAAGGEHAKRPPRAAPASGTPPVPTRVPIKAEGKTILLRADEISRLEADGNHTIVHFGRQSVRTREHLWSVLARLPEHQFLRVQRSVVVNVDAVREVHTWFHGDFVLVLHDGTRLTSGPTYRNAVQKLIGG